VIWEDINDVELEVDEFADLFSKADLKPKEKKVIMAFFMTYLILEV
jgi:hypothetical protein